MPRPRSKEQQAGSHYRQAVGRGSSKPAPGRVWKTRVEARRLAPSSNSSIIKLQNSSQSTWPSQLVSIFMNKSASCARVAAFHPRGEVRRVKGRALESTVAARKDQRTPGGRTFCTAVQNSSMARPSLSAASNAVISVAMSSGRRRLSTFMLWVQLSTTGGGEHDRANLLCFPSPPPPAGPDAIVEEEEAGGQTGRVGYAAGLKDRWLRRGEAGPVASPGAASRPSGLAGAAGGGTQPVRGVGADWL